MSTLAPTLNLPSLNQFEKKQIVHYLNNSMSIASQPAKGHYLKLRSLVQNDDMRLGMVEKLELEEFLKNRISVTDDKPTLEYLNSLVNLVRERTGGRSTPAPEPAAATPEENGQLDQITARKINLYTATWEDNKPNTQQTEVTKSDTEPIKERKKPGPKPKLKPEATPPAATPPPPAPAENAAPSASGTILIDPSSFDKKTGELLLNQDPRPVATVKSETIVFRKSCTDISIIRNGSFVKFALVNAQFFIVGVTNVGDKGFEIKGKDSKLVIYNKHLAQYLLKNFAVMPGTEFVLDPKPVSLDAAGMGYQFLLKEGGQPNA